MKKPVTLNIAKKLKKIGFNYPVYHAYVNYKDNLYSLEYFYYKENYFGSDNISIILNYFKTKNNNDYSFNYNQDFRPILLKKLYGNSKCNLKYCFDSYSYYKNSNIIYNENLDVYTDLISAPYNNEALDWFRDYVGCIFYIGIDENNNYYFVINKIKYKEKYKNYQETEKQLIKNLIKKYSL